jgi:hypothetical protein
MSGMLRGKQVERKDKERDPVVLQQGKKATGLWNLQPETCGSRKQH